MAKVNGHDAGIISAKLVSLIRLNQKSDKNDALAIMPASQFKLCLKMQRMDLACHFAKH